MNKILRRYWLPLVLVIVGSIVALCGVGTATIWKPSSRVVTSLPTAASKQTMAITRPGMFELYDSPTKITVSGQGKVALAIGRSTDVTAWAADQNYVEVTGQKDQDTLLTEPHPGKGKARQPGEAAGKDMWVKYKEVKGGPITEIWDRSEGAWSLIAWSEEGNVQLTLQWTQVVSTPWFWPLLIAGLLLVLIGAVVAIVINRLAKAAAKEEAEVRARRKQRAEQAAAAQAAQTVQMPSLNAVAHPPSRAALRKARERGEATIEVDGVKFPTGLVPVIRTDEDGKAIKPEAATSPAPVERVSLSPAVSNVELPAPAETTLSAPIAATADIQSAQSPQPGQFPQPQASYNPADSYQPAQSPQPSNSYQPETSYNPAQSPQPAQSYQPADSYRPQASYNPAQSNQPQPAQSAQPQAAQSYQPEVSYNPADSYRPQVSFNPEQSAQPAQLYQPQPAQASYNPAASYHPETSYNPADSYQPAQSYEPQAAQSYQPQASYNPADSYQPQASYNPAQSAQPAQSYQSAPAAEASEEWFEDDDFDLDGLGEGPDIGDFEGKSTFDQGQGGQQ